MVTIFLSVLLLAIALALFLLAFNFLVEKIKPESKYLASLSKTESYLTSLNLSLILTPALLFNTTPDFAYLKPVAVGLGAVMYSVGLTLTFASLYILVVKKGLVKVGPLSNNRVEGFNFKVFGTLIIIMGFWYYYA